MPQRGNEEKAPNGDANTNANTADDGWEPEHRAVDRRLREYARHRSALDAAEALDLVRAEQFKLYAHVGCSSHYDYMERILGYGPHAARERMRVARALVRLPATTAALARGELTYSGVRELTRVATDETEAEWLERANGLVVNQIEKLVAHHQRGDRPDDPTRPDLRPRVVRLELPPEVFALWRQARMVVAEERGSEIGDADVMQALCRAVIAPGTGANGPVHQIAYQQCPDCRRATQNGAGRQVDIPPEVFERAACDAKNLGSLDAAAPERATTTVTPRIREQVFARDQYRCTVPGCRSARNLDIHHIEFQSHGGGHEISNLTLLCSGHHAALHAGLLALKGKAPYMIEFRWMYRPPIPCGLDPAARDALIRQRFEDALEEIFPDSMPEPALTRPARSSGSPTTASPTIAGPTIAGPIVAGPTVASRTIASPTIASPTIASPAIASPTTARRTTARRVEDGGVGGRETGYGPTSEGGPPRGASTSDTRARPVWDVEVLVPPASPRWRGPAGRM